MIVAIVQEEPIVPPQEVKRLIGSIAKPVIMLQNAVLNQILKDTTNIIKTKLRLDITTNLCYHTLNNGGSNES